MRHYNIVQQPRALFLSIQSLDPYYHGQRQNGGAHLAPCALRRLATVLLVCLPLRRRVHQIAPRQHQIAPSAPKFVPARTEGTPNSGKLSRPKRTSVQLSVYFRAFVSQEELFWFSHQLYQNKKSLIIIFLLSFGLVLSLFFCLSIEWTQTYVSIIIFRQFLTAAENNQIKKQKIYYNITSQKEKEPNIAYIHIQNCLFWVFGLTQNLLL